MVFCCDVLRASMICRWLLAIFLTTAFCGVTFIFANRMDGYPEKYLITRPMSSALTAQETCICLDNATLMVHGHNTTV
jgi:hypothetical protein